MKKIITISFFILLSMAVQAQGLDISTQSQYAAMRDSAKSVAVEMEEIDTDNADFISETYQIPGYALYDKYWDTENLCSRPLNIPFEGNPLRIILVQSNNNPFLFPCMGELKTVYGEMKGYCQPGVELTLKSGAPVKTCFDGVVRMAKIYGDYGRVVVVRHYNGLETVYAHLSRIMVKPGQILRAGDVLGVSGKSGKSGEEILHFETRFMNESFNPDLFIDFDEMDLKDNTLILNEGDLEKKVVEKQEKPKTIPMTGNKQPVDEVDSAVQYHIVKAGETMYRISVQYKVPLNRLLQMNNMTENNATISVGQKIRVR
ncbi:MAG: peptidoglycan DD-metalloendopeptidase family protein [Bacteroidales bacterium]|nr:peptidoglycan DD-metalloendopeptidase family protein [Bacteroidales bacterium]